MTVREAMNPVGVTVGSSHSMREAARRMTEGATGAAVVIDSDLPAPGIVTERDVLRCVGEGGDLDAELVGDHLTANAVVSNSQFVIASPTNPVPPPTEAESHDTIEAARQRALAWSETLPNFFCVETTDHSVES